MKVKPNIMMLMNDDDNHYNVHKIPVSGNVKCILGIRSSISCYEKKGNERSRNTKGKITRTVLKFNVTVRVN